MRGERGGECEVYSSVKPFADDWGKARATEVSIGPEEKPRFAQRTWGLLTRDAFCEENPEWGLPRGRPWLDLGCYAFRHRTAEAIYSRVIPWVDDSGASGPAEYPAVQKKKERSFSLLLFRCSEGSRLKLTRPAGSPGSQATFPDVWLWPDVAKP